MKNILTVTAACVVLSACAQDNSLRTGFNSAAGSQLDTGNFGAATMNNSLIQSGDADYTINLARRFAQEVNSTVTFPFNSTALDEAARATLRKQATWIKQFPEVRFKVFGHTDLVGGESYNDRLGLARARAAFDDLREYGLTLSMELRNMELLRLDAALVEVNRVISKHRSNPEIVLKAVDRLTRLSESRRKLLGIDQPQRIDVTTGGEPMQKRIVIVDSQDGTGQRRLTHDDEIETYPEISE